MSNREYDLYRHQIPAEIIAYMPSEWARYFGVVPIELGTQDFIVAMADEHPNNVDLVRFLLNRPDVDVVQVSAEALRFALDRYYPV